jgi:hypothetical protein
LRIFGRLARITPRQKAQRGSPKMFDLIGVRDDFHPIDQFGRTGGNWMRLARNFHQTHSANADGHQPRIIA